MLLLGISSSALDCSSSLQWDGVLLPRAKIPCIHIFPLLCWHGWLIYVNWCASLYKGCCDQGQTRNFLPYRTFSVCCCCVEGWYHSRGNCYFNSVFTNCLLTPAISCHVWGAAQCTGLELQIYSAQMGLHQWSCPVLLQDWIEEIESEAEAAATLLNFLPTPRCVSKLVPDLGREHKPYQRSRISTPCVI